MVKASGYMTEGDYFSAFDAEILSESELASSSGEEGSAKTRESSTAQEFDAEILSESAGLEVEENERRDQERPKEQEKTPSNLTVNDFPSESTQPIDQSLSEFARSLLAARQSETSGV